MDHRAGVLATRLGFGPQDRHLDHEALMRKKAMMGRGDAQGVSSQLQHKEPTNSVSRNSD